MVKICFVCHGNICRSVGAQYILQNMVNKAGAQNLWLIDSAATSTEEIGNPIYPPMREALVRAGVPIGDHRARQLRKSDYGRYDLFIGMDEENLFYMRQILGHDPEGKFHYLMEYTDHPDEKIDDPWYTRKFDYCTQQITEGCKGLLSRVRESHPGKACRSRDDKPEGVTFPYITDEAMGNFTIRKSVPDDLSRMMQIYARARQFMAEHRNPNQWGPTNWPPEELIRRDIKELHSYVCMSDGRIVCTFFYDFGENVEPTYRNIEDGCWKDSSPYGVIHRLASDGSVKGSGSFCIKWALSQGHHLRVDTHPDNIVMQNLLTKLGFSRCGIIHVVEDNDPRYAYEIG